MKQNATHKTAAIILAAGASKRLGHPKQLVMFADETLLERTVKRALNSPLRKIIVVLGKSAERFQKLLQPYNVEIAINQNWSAGISSSIAVGLKRLDEQVSFTATVFDSALFLTCDQPFLTAELITQILQKYASTKSPIIASAYADCLGIPALFNSKLFPELLKLEGDRGAGVLIKKYKNSVSSIPFPAGEIDVDTEADLKFIQRQE